MRAANRLLLILALLASAGCAARQTAIMAESGEPCVPSGVAPISTWENPKVEHRLLIGEDGQPIRGAKVRYDTPNGALMVVWVRGLVVAVDPAPDDPAAPMLYDDGLATSGGNIIVDGVQSCRWKPLGGADARR